MFAGKRSPSRSTASTAEKISAAITGCRRIMHVLVSQLGKRVLLVVWVYDLGVAAPAHTGEVFRPRRRIHNPASALRITSPIGRLQQ